MKLKMAYPIKLFDNNDDYKIFLSNVSTLTELFGPIHSRDKIRRTFDIDPLPEYLIDLGNNIIKNTMKDMGDIIPEKTWQSKIGIYGRKDGTVIKKSDNILYRIIINIGETEVYNICGSQINEPVVLPDGYALLMSPTITEDVDIKVSNNPVRKNIDPKISEFVPKIRSRKYLRYTIILDLLYPKID